LGFSLGSYLALAAAIDDRRIPAVVEMAGGIPPGWEDRIGPDMASVLLLHGGKDPVVPLSEAYKAQRLLTERGVTCELEVFAGERHWIGGQAHQRLLDRCAAFLKANL